MVDYLRVQKGGNMKKSYIKKFAMILTVLMVFTIFSNFSLGTEHSTNESQSTDEPVIEMGQPEIEENQSTEDKLEDANLNDASEKILTNVTKSERKKANYIDKYNDKFFGTVAYALDVARLYSFPICFVGITIGAFNFLIVGNKKLDKKEQGFGWIVGFTIAIVVFNVLPLLYAVLVAGR